jgi:hypothetical protein
LINNEFRDFLLQAFFRIMAEADFQNAQAGGGIDYTPEAQVPDDGDINIDEDIHGNIIGVRKPQFLIAFQGFRSLSSSSSLLA